MRGCRTHQKTSTSATKSGTRRRSRQGRKLSSSATTNETMMVLARTGIRIDWVLPGNIGLPPGILVLGRVLRGVLRRPRAARFLAAALLAALRLLGLRRQRRLVGEDEHVAAAVDAGRGL